MTELAFLAAFAYPAFNHFYWLPKQKPHLEAEITHELHEYNHMELFRYKTNYRPPMFVSAGQHVSIPVGGGTYMDTEQIYTVTVQKKTHAPMFEQFQQLSASPSHEQYINTHATLENLVRNCGVPDNKFPITLPLLVRHYRFPNGIFVHPIGFLGASKHAVLQAALKKRSLPFATATGVIAGTCLALCWGHYALQPKYKYTQAYSYIQPYYPPFHLKRLSA